MASFGKEQKVSPEETKRILKEVPGLDKSKWREEELKKIHGEHYQGEVWDKDREQRKKAA